MTKTIIMVKTNSTLDVCVHTYLRRTNYFIRSVKLRIFLSTLISYSDYSYIKNSDNICYMYNIYKYEA